MNPLTITVNSNATVTNGRGYLVYYLEKGDDNFTDTGSAPSHIYGDDDGDDILVAGSGADTLIGGAGNDTLTGGSGNDMFVDAATDNGLDTITDFGSGDAIRVTDRNFTSGTITIGDGATVAANSVQTSVSGGTTTLHIDTDATTNAAELPVHLTGNFLPGNFRLDGEYIRYNNIPAVGGATAVTNLNVSTAASTSPFAAFTVTDADTAQTQTVTVTLDTAAKGALSNLSSGTYDAATGVYSVTGTAAQAQATIRALVFTPTANRVAAGATETTTFTVSVDDGAAGCNAADF